MEQSILNFIQHVYQSIGWPGVVVLMAIESACIPLPSEVIMPLAGWMLIANRGLGFNYVLLAGVLGAIGNVVGSLIAYFVGAYGGAPVLEKYGKYVLVSHRDIERADYWFNRHGQWIVLLSRLVPGVRTFISLPAGICRMGLARFTGYSLLGSFPWSLGLAWGGYALGKNWEQIRSAMRPFDWPIVSVIVVLAAVFFMWRIREIMMESRRRGRPNP